MKNRKNNIYKDAWNTVHAPAELTSKIKRLKQYPVPDAGHAKPKKRIKYAKAATAAAVFAIVLSLPTTSFASYIKEIFTGFWSSQDEAANYVQQNVYEDEDQHIRMCVEEVLSDEVCVHAVIKYTAKDETGRQWLKDYNPRRQAQDGLYITSDYKSGHGVSGARDSVELTKYRTENERYFEVYFLAAQWYDFTKQCALSYTLPSGYKYTPIDTRCNVPFYEYNLKPQTAGRLSKYYEPKIIRISQLSIVVYGKNTGMIVNEDASAKNYDNAGYRERLHPDFAAQGTSEHCWSAKLLKKDGSEIIIDDSINAVCGGIVKDKGMAEETYDECDCLVLSGCFYRLKYPFTESSDFQTEPDIVHICPEELNGIEIATEKSSVTYQFEPLSN